MTIVFGFSMEKKVSLNFSEKVEKNLFFDKKQIFFAKKMSTGTK